MRQSDILTDFYRLYVEWLDSCSWNTADFKRDHGICLCLEKYLYNRHYPKWYIQEVLKELTTQFINAGLHKHYPFNQGDVFYYEKEKQTKHLNPMRIKWVRDHAMIDGKGITYHE